MKSPIAAGTCVAAALAIGTVAFAQSTAQSQPPTPQTSQSATQAPGAEQVTITGCVQKEADYRAANNLGKGGAAGSGVGAGDEYVLIDATITPAGAVGTSGTTPPAGAAPMAFELTGSNEEKVGEFVGKRVEIVGKLKPAEMGAAGPTGGASAGKPPAGVDVASKDLKLREVDVSSVKEAAGTCPAK